MANQSEQSVRTRRACWAVRDHLGHFLSHDFSNQSDSIRDNLERPRMCQTCQFHFIKSYEPGAGIIHGIDVDIGRAMLECDVQLEWIQGVEGLGDSRNWWSLPASSLDSPSLFIFKVRPSANYRSKHKLNSARFKSRYFEVGLGG